MVRRACYSPGQADRVVEPPGTASKGVRDNSITIHTQTTKSTTTIPQTQPSRCSSSSIIFFRFHCCELRRVSFYPKCATTTTIKMPSPPPPPHPSEARKQSLLHTISRIDAEERVIQEEIRKKRAERDTLQAVHDSLQKTEERKGSK